MALGAMELEANNKPLILNRVKFKVVLVWAANGIVEIVHHRLQKDREGLLRADRVSR